MKARLSGLLAMLIVVGTIQAQDRLVKSDVKAEPKRQAWELEINAEALRESGLIDKLMFMMDDANEVLGLVKVYEDVIGLNPLKDINKVRFQADSIDVRSLERNPIEAAKGVLLEVELAKRGNLEGLLLAAPNYKSELVNGTRIHSCAIEDTVTVHFAFIDGKDGSTRIMAAMENDIIKKAAKSSTSESPLDVRKSDTKTIARFSLSDSAFKGLKEAILAEIGGKGPPIAVVRNVAGMLGGISAELAHQNNELKLKAILAVNDRDQVKQLQQFISAGLNLARILAIQEADDPEFTAIAKALDNKMKVAAKDKNIEIEFGLDALLGVLR